jgi:alpha-mannosidase
MDQYPDWKINLEIEPETWDSAQVREPEAYLRFKNKFQHQHPKNSTIEFVSPAYGQSYLFNISGESIIRQFEYGMQKISQHFPGAEFATYSSEEPCFTSALPGILRSFGFKYASLKNPNTCWGGYTRGSGGEILNWVGPDGTKIPTVPRYASEKLASFSTWQTDAWTNSDSYFSDAKKIGVKNPVGMCLQDAGWRNGPWLLKKQGSTQYTTWQNYFENVAGKPKTDWKLSQEDIQVSLVWGSQKLQQIAQMVRMSENKLLAAEKLSAMAHLTGNFEWPDKEIREAWRNLLLAQHHDCWIVPLSWFDRVNGWIAGCNRLTDSIISEAKNHLLKNTNKQTISVINLSGFYRKELASVCLPVKDYRKGIKIMNAQNKQVPSQINYKAGRDSFELLFIAEIPPTSGRTFYLHEGARAITNTTIQPNSLNGRYLLETDLYKVQINARSGIIESLKTEKDQREFVSVKDGRGLNELKGFFYQQNKFLSSCEGNKTIALVEDGPLRKKVKIEGTLGIHRFTQYITLTNGEKKIDFRTTINWIKNEGIGDGHAQNESYDEKDRYKAFYVDSSKLNISFPSNLSHPKLFKDAPFDVTESRLPNTFFNSWDSIKNNIIYRWIDLYDADRNQGIALFTDHTSSYSFGEDFPLSLTFAYSGKGLWHGDYELHDSSTIDYALMPHDGDWKDATVNQESTRICEPLIILNGSLAKKIPNPLFDLSGTGYELTSLRIEGGILTARFYNAGGKDHAAYIKSGIPVQNAEWVNLKGESEGKTETVNNKILLQLPRFGFRTLQLKLK